MNPVDIESAIDEVDSVYGRIAFFRNDLYLGRSLREYGEWAQKELDFLSGFITEGAFVVDVGAFIGTHAIAFSSFVGPHGRVYSFEPHPTYFHVLQRNLASNGLTNVSAFNTGLSDRTGEMTIAELDLGAPNSLGSVQLRPTKSDGNTNVITVKVTTLDDLRLEACHLIKIDVEGMEGVVLSGGRATIQRHQPLIYAECNSADSAWPVVLLMRSLGYHIYLYSEEAYNPKNFRKNPLNIFGRARELSLVCVPPHLEGMFRRRLSPSLDVVRIDRLDDLVLCLIKKPQYKEEVLANSSGVRLWGNDFWKNEGELEQLAEREHEIAGFRRSVAERDRQIADLSQSIVERDGQIVSLGQRAAERDAQIAAVSQTVSERDIHIAALNQNVAEHEAKVRELQKQLTLCEQSVQAIYTSRSWRFTSTFRVLANITRAVKRRTREIISQRVRGVYRNLPLSIRQKQRLKNVVFSSFGWAFSSTVAYQHWKALRELKALQTPLVAKAESSGMKGTNSGSEAIAELWVADGIVEWADYASVRDRIRAIRHQQLESAEISPRRTIDLGRNDLRQAAQQILLPDPGLTVDVSIVVPVYNNLKYTIECLLSMCAHTGDALRYEVIVADDASTDDTRSVLAGVPHLRLATNESNLGFLRNCNRAAELARGRYVLFLNNDVQVTPGWLESMVRVFDEESGVGAVGPMIVYPDGHLQEAGARLRRDATAEMIGLFGSPEDPRYRYRRDVDYCSGACLLMETRVFRELGGFDPRYVPAYCEDADLCLRIRKAGRRVVYCPDSVIVHHLSKTSDLVDNAFKLRCVARNMQQLTETWQNELDRDDDVRMIAFYLPQFHPIPENDLWWGKGFTEWRNVAKAHPNFVGHYQPRLPTDLGYYDLRNAEVLEEQTRLAKRYGIYGFCFYYYWFGGKRLLERPLEQMLETGRPQMPFCLCWANENWTRRWDGNDADVLMAQSHSDEDDTSVIRDLIRYFRSPHYIRIRGKPLILVYRVALFPDFARTALIWRQECRKAGVGEIYIAMVESFELVTKGVHPAEYGCDAGVEFPPQGLAEQRPPSGPVVNPCFRGMVADYRELAARFATRPNPGYTRFRAVAPGWDNTARRQNDSFCFENSTPGAFQAWLESAMDETKQQHSGDERLLFVNAWNEWAEGAYLEPDFRFGHTFLEAVRNAKDASALVRGSRYALGQ